MRFASLLLLLIATFAAFAFAKQPLEENTSNLMALRNLPQSGSAECYACTLFIGTIERWVSSNQSIEEMREYLQKHVCSGFEMEYMREICDFFVEMLPQIVAWIETEESPQIICEQLGFCDNAMEKDRKKLQPLKQ